MSDRQIDQLALNLHRFTADFVERGIVGDATKLRPV
jgi:hypothetical protein